MNKGVTRYVPKDRHLSDPECLFIRISMAIGDYNCKFRSLWSKVFNNLHIYDGKLHAYFKSVDDKNENRTKRQKQMIQKD